MDAYIGEIRPFVYAFAPLGWLDCDGTVYQMSSYNALGALLGATYGGDGRNTFGVPDLRGKVPFGFGISDFGTYFTLGSSYGSAQCTLTAANVPAHSHSSVFVPTNPTAVGVNISVINAAANQPGPKDNYLAQSTGYNTYAAPGTGPSGILGGTSLSLTGSATVQIGVGGNPSTPIPFNKTPSFGTLRLCICTDGEFPVRP
jgi:microcystin-dependent protein